MARDERPQRQIDGYLFLIEYLTVHCNPPHPPDQFGVDVTSGSSLFSQVHKPPLCFEILTMMPFAKKCGQHIYIASSLGDPFATRQALFKNAILK